MKNTIRYARHTLTAVILLLIVPSMGNANPRAGRQQSNQTVDRTIYQANYSYHPVQQYIQVLYSSPTYVSGYDINGWRVTISTQDGAYFFGAPAGTQCHQAAQIAQAQGRYLYISGQSHSSAYFWGPGVSYPGAWVYHYAYNRRGVPVYTCTVL